MHDRPALDHRLCLRAQLYASGQDVHTAASLLTTYLGEHKIKEFVPERFEAAEIRLRAFVVKLLLHNQS